jgi:hypothetical protein
VYQSVLELRMGLILDNSILENRGAAEDCCHLNALVQMVTQDLGSSGTLGPMRGRCTKTSRYVLKVLSRRPFPRS